MSAITYVSLMIDRDIVNGGSCRFDPATNLPDENCIFIPRGDNSDVRSSYMSTPFLENVDHFCEHTETTFHHDRYLPNKQNFMCNQRSTWEVIEQNIDFMMVGFKPMNTSLSPPPTTFTILQPDDGRFTLVLDRSGSMEDQDRWIRLVQSSTRWIEFDIKAGTQLGITSFRHCYFILRLIYNLFDQKSITFQWGGVTGKSTDTNK